MKISTLGNPNTGEADGIGEGQQSLPLLAQLAHAGAGDSEQQQLFLDAKATDCVKQTTNAIRITPINRWNILD